MGIGLGIAALVAAYLIAWKGIGPDWLAQRLAAVVALCGVQSVVTGTALGDKLKGWAADGAEQLGKLAGHLDPQYQQPVTAWAVPIVVGTVGLLWVAAMLPGMTARYIGRIANQEHSSALIWGGALALGVFSASAPGEWGDLLQSLVVQLGGLGASLTKGTLA